MVFKNPIALIIILFFIPLFRRIIVREHANGFVFPDLTVVADFRPGLKEILAKKIIWLRVLSIFLLIVALSRPQIEKKTPIHREGIGMVVAIDCSSTMLADDIKLSFEERAEYKEVTGSNITRLDAVKLVAKDFIANRTDDMIGLVAFAAEAYEVSPPTFDREWAQKALERIQIGLIKDGTAIGSGIMASARALRDTSAKSKIIILLTDGINNYGNISPAVAAQTCRTLGVKIYTIGVTGKSGFVDLGDKSGRKVYRVSDIPIDEKELKSIAAVTGGQYYRVEDMEELKKSYGEIDHLEKTPISEQGDEEYVDLFPGIVVAVFLMTLLEIILTNTVLRKIP